MPHRRNATTSPGANSRRSAFHGRTGAQKRPCISLGNARPGDVSNAKELRLGLEANCVTAESATSWQQPSEASAAKSGARGQSEAIQDDELAVIVSAWAGLAANIRAAMLLLATRD